MKSWIIFILWLGFPVANAEPGGPVWDLREPLRDEQLVPLNYPWELYWQELLGPEDPVHQPTTVVVPPRLRWADIQDVALPGRGYGTYRMRFKGLPPRAEGYELKVHHEVSAYLVLLYREDQPSMVYRLGNGIVGPTAAATAAQELPKTLHFTSPSEAAVWVVLMQVANFHHARGGMWRAPVIGPAPVLSQMMQREFDIILVAVGVQLVMGIYNFVIFLRRRQEFSSLLLAICCLLAMIRSIANGFLVSYFFPDIFTSGFQLQYGLDYSTMIGLSCCYVAFIHSSYPGHLKAWETRVIPWYLSLNSIFALTPALTSTAFFTDYKNYFLSLTFFNLVVGFVILVRIVEQSRASSRLAMTGFLLMFATASWDLLCSFGLVPEPFLTPYGLTIFIFLQSQVVAGRFAAAFRTAEHLSRKLQHEVSSQTQKLQMQREKLEKQHGDLLRSHRDLQAVHEEKNGFFRHISHEIRTPLTLILGTITNTRRTAQYDQGLGVIEKNSLRLLRLVNQLLDLQRYQSLKDPVHSTPLLFTQTMQNATDYVQQTCQELGIRFVWLDEIPRRDERILGQVDALEKILLNYLSNAMKYTPSGGEIRVRLQLRDRWLRCTVEDTGPGIRSEDLGQLFQVFSRLKDNDQKLREGTGLGLALCRELAASMQGRVGVSSELAQGSQFWLEFPRLLRPDEYCDLVCWLGDAEDARTLPALIQSHSQLRRCFHTEVEQDFRQQIREQNCRLALISKGSDPEATLACLRDLHEHDPELLLFLVLDQQERVEYVHQVMQTGAVEHVFYRPLSSQDIEILESYRMREILTEKPLLDLLFLDDHAEVRAHFSRAIAEHTLIEHHLCCHSVEEAKNILRQYRVKVVVSDLNLNAANGNGMDLLQFATRVQPDAFRILLSAENSAYKIQEIMRSVSIHKLLFKPFEGQRDMAIIQSFVDQSPLQPIEVPEDLGAKDRAALYMSDVLPSQREPKALKVVSTVTPRNTAPRRAKILLVDDVMDMRQMIAEILSDAGMVVVECEDGREALKRLQEDGEHFDLVVSDWMMPRLTGLELLQAMRSHDLTRTIPCILLTAKMKHEVETALPSDGITRYVAKPFDHLHFAEIVERMLPKLMQDPVPGTWQTLTFLQIRWHGLGHAAELQGPDKVLQRWQEFHRLIEDRARAASAIFGQATLHTQLIVFNGATPAEQIAKVFAFLEGLSFGVASRVTLTLAQGSACLLHAEWIGPAIDELSELWSHRETAGIICNANAAASLPDAERIADGTYLVTWDKKRLCS